MNIKIKMPKFWRNLQWGGIAKELVLTFVGTTLSIVLTFGTAHYMEQKQLRADGRQTAMMVIHDMENSAELFEQYAKQEEEQFKMTQYVFEQIDRIESIPADTLSAAYLYVTQYTKRSLYTYDDSNEKLFLSSQDVWKNINNATFIDIAQQFFHLRRIINEGLNNSDLFTKPIPHDELREYYDTAKTPGFDYVAFLSKRLTRPNVTYYVNGFQQRVRTLNEYSTSMQEYAKRCKFIMDISDAELKAYLENRKHGGHPLKKNKMIGTWVMRDDMDYYDYAEFKDDYSLVSVKIYHLAHQNFVGRAEFKFIFKGTWDIQGDSLITCLHNTYECSLDTSQIHIVPDKEQEMRTMIAEWYDYLKTQQEEAAKTDTVYRSSWAAFMDSRGEKIETWRMDEETGKETCTYLIKKEE